MQVNLLVNGHPGKVGLVGQAGQYGAVSGWAVDDLSQGQQLGHVVHGFARQLQVPVIGWQAEGFITFDGTANAAFAAVVGRQGQQPVAVEVAVEQGQVIQRGAGGGGNVAAAVVPPVLTQREVAPGGRDKLPQAGGLGAGDRLRVVGALDKGQQGQFQRHLALVQLLNHIVEIALGTSGGQLEIARLAGKHDALLVDTRVVDRGRVKGEAGANAAPEGMRFGGFGDRGANGGGNGWSREGRRHKRLDGLVELPRLPVALAVGGLTATDQQHRSEGGC